MDRGRLCPAPGQRHEPGVARLEQGARGGLAALEAEAHVAGEGQRDVRVGGGGPTLVVAVRGVLPPHRLLAVVEHRLAVHDGLHLSRDATDGAQQDVFGLVVVRRALVGHRAVVLVVPRTDQQDIAHDHPPGRRTPAGLQDHRPRQVAASGRDADVQRGHAERAGSLAEDGPEDTRRVETRHAHPVHRAGRCHERRHLAVAQESVVPDRHRPRTLDRTGQARGRLAALRHVCSIVRRPVDRKDT